MSKYLNITIRTPDKEVYNGKAKFIKLITEGGIMKILPGHADLTGSVGFSPLIFETDHKTEEDYIIRQALLRVDNRNKSVEIMAIDCKLKYEMSYYDAEEYLKFIEEEMAKGHDLSEFKITYLEEERIAVQHMIKHSKK